jgi:hypothetical protein
MAEIWHWDHDEIWWPERDLDGDSEVNDNHESVTTIIPDSFCDYVILCDDLLTWYGRKILCDIRHWYVTILISLF